MEDADAVLDIIQQTGLLEFVDTGDRSLEPGAIIVTDFGTDGASPSAGEGTQIVYHTVMTGKDLDTVAVAQKQLGTAYSIDFTLPSEGAVIFGDHTAANVGKFLTITLDKRVISSPSINSAIPDGAGTITGNFTPEEANALAVQLKYGSLPIPLKVVETRIIGPTLGEDSSFPFHRVTEYYKDGMVSTLDKDLIRNANPRVVVDYAYSSASQIFPSILGELGIDVIALNAHIDETKITKSKAMFDRGLSQLSQIVKSLETSNHRIGFDFIIEGNLENPQFNFRGSLVKRFTVGLAKSLGLSVIDAGETVIIQGGRAIRDVGKELQKLFK